jgi:uncharacterized protein (TIGR03435 family)
LTASLRPEVRNWPTFRVASQSPVSSSLPYSPRAEWVKKAANNLQGGFVNGGRYELRRATMLDLIRAAYSVDAEKIYGGPSWLDYDRFEIEANVAPGTRPICIRSGSSAPPSGLRRRSVQCGPY